MRPKTKKCKIEGCKARPTQQEWKTQEERDFCLKHYCKPKAMKIVEDSGVFKKLDKYYGK
jgi:hypothetical protein